jgi:phage gpG-like protein
MTFNAKFTSRGPGLGAAVREFSKGTLAKVPKLLEDAGRFMVRTHIPEVFATHGAAAGEIWPAVRRDGEALRDTGTLQRSFLSRVEGKTLTIATAVIYAGVHNDGDGNGGDYVQTPKKAKKLAIPLPTLSVSERRTGAFLTKDKAKRKELGTFVAKSTKGNLIIFQKKDNGEIRPLYVLVDRVVIPRRTFMTWSEQAINEIVDRWGDILLEGRASA